jgi:hypothetical protein
VSKAPSTKAKKKTASNDTTATKNKGAPRVHDLIKIAQTAELFRDPEGHAFATVSSDGYQRTHLIRSSGFRQWLLTTVMRNYATFPGKLTIDNGLVAIEVVALNEKRETPVHFRIAQSEDAIYIDIGSESGEVIHVTRGGWSIIRDAPVRFRRTANMAALPLPVAGGNIDELRQFVNVGTCDDFTMLVGFLLGALSGNKNYPIVTLIGEQGSAKSTLALVIRALIDPVRKAPSRSLPGSERDLVISMSHSHLLIFDNISSLKTVMSDALCRVSTGSGFGTRQLYSNDDEAIFGGARPICMNGIEQFVERADLLSRCIVLDLPTITTTTRRDDTSFWRDFHEASARILGALLDGLSSGLRHRSTTQLAEKPRMAEFALWATACESGVGWVAGTFMTAYRKNIASCVDISLDASPLANAVLELMEKRVSWEGTATELLKSLNRRADNDIKRLKAWPKAANRLSNQIRRLRPSFRAVGVDIGEDRKGHDSTRVITITKVVETENRTEKTLIEVEDLPP